MATCSLIVSFNIVICKPPKLNTQFRPSILKVRFPISIISLSDGDGDDNSDGGEYVRDDAGNDDGDGSGDVNDGAGDDGDGVAEVMNVVTRRGHPGAASSA